MFYVVYEKETETKARVSTIYYGAENLPAEIADKPDSLLQVEELPVAPTPAAGKGYLLYANPTTGELYHEEFARPLSQEEQIKELQAQNAQMLLALVMNDLL